jgi:glutaredoxin 3
MITLYTKPGCPWCVKAKELLKTKGVAYHEIMIDNASGDMTREEFINLFPSIKSLPYILDENSKSIGGYGELIDYLNP